MPLMLDGVPARQLARRWGVPEVRLHRVLSSTLDIVHELGALGSPNGLTVIAEEQTAGRGRDGRRWHSPLGGVWISMLIRTPQAEFATVSVRVGLVTADVIDELLRGTRHRSCLKWPNDVLLDSRKVAGVLCEGRWQGDTLHWLAVGVGINVWNEMPGELNGQATSLYQFAPHVRRLDVLDRLVPALQSIGTGAPVLAESERRAFAERDWLAGRVLRAPIAGRVQGIAEDGALLVEREGVTTAVRDGHVELA